MAIVGGLDLHRNQITFDYLETETGQVSRGVIRPTTRDHLRGWLQRFQGQQASFALEATTGWRFVVEERRAAGLRAHLPIPGPCGALRDAPRPTARTPATSVSCCRPLACPSPGSHPHTSSSRAPWSACARRWSTSGGPGSSASRPCYSTTAARPAPTSRATGARLTWLDSSSLQRPDRRSSWACA